MATTAQLIQLGVRPKPGDVRPSNIQLSQTGARALDLSAFATAAGGNLLSIANTGNGDVFLKFGEPTGELPTYPPTLVAPGGLWNGTAGSGGTPPTAASEHPSMPRAACLTPNYERFVADGHIDFYCRHPSGLALVEAWVEGATYSVPVAPRIVAFPGFDDDASRIAGVHRLTVDHAAFPQDGDFRVYLRVVAADGAAEERVIGPFQFNRKTGSYYDAEILQDPSQPNVAGVSYNTPQAAMTYLSTHPELRYVRIKATQSHTVDFNGVASGGTWRSGSNAVSRQGNVDFWPAEGVEVLWKNDAFTRMQIRMLQEGVRYRKGMRLDTRNLTYNHDWDTGAALRPHAICGAEVFSSLGATDPGGGTGDPAQGFPSTVIFGTHFYLYEAHWHDMVTGPAGARAMRFCNVHDITGDAVNLASGRPEGVFNYGTRCANLDCQLWRDGPVGITLTYSGGSSAAAWSRSGNNFILREGNPTLADAHTIVCSTTQGSGIYTISQLVDEINTKPGWTATLQFNDWRATSVGFKAANGGTSTDIPCKSPIVSQVGCGFDVHADGVQLANSNFQNMLMVNVTFTGAVQDVQTWFLDAQPTGATSGISIVNGHTSCTTESSISQVSNAHFGLEMAHLTAPASIVWYRGGSDSDDFVADEWGSLHGCLFYKVTMRAAAAATQGDLFPITGMATEQVQTNVGYAPGVPLPGALATGNFPNIDMSAVLPNWAGGDWRPTGGLADGTRLIAAAEGFDVAFRPRASLTTPGSTENYARIPAGRTVTFPVEWARINGVYAVTDGADIGVSVGQFALSAKSGAGETGSTISRTLTFDVAA